jgi:hypothetical protein
MWEFDEWLGGSGTADSRAYPHASVQNYGRQPLATRVQLPGV